MHGKGVVHDAGIKRPLRVVNHGSCVVDCLVKKVFQVGIVDGLDKALKELVDKKETKMKGKGRSG